MRRGADQLYGHACMHRHAIDVLYDFVGGINKYYPKVTDGNINYMK